MNIIEKIAKALWDYNEVPFNFNNPESPMAELQKSIFIDQAKVSLETIKNYIDEILN